MVLMFFLGVLAVYALGYIFLGPFFWILGVFYKDYPGPVKLTTGPDGRKRVKVLCVHGASGDARFFTPYLKAFSEECVVSVSLGDHFKGVQYAFPDGACSESLLRFLDTLPEPEYIVCHSTGCSWLAYAYFLNPQAFKSVKQFIFLSPFFGHLASGQESLVNLFLLKFSFLLPNPFWHFFSTAPFQSSDAEERKCSKKAYLAGRTFIYGSLVYYNTLLRFVRSDGFNVGLKTFFEAERGRCMIYLAEDDHVVDNIRVRTFLKDVDVSFKMLKKCSHHGSILRWKIWHPIANF